MFRWFPIVPTPDRSHLQWGTSPISPVEMFFFGSNNRKADFKRLRRFGCQKTKYAKKKKTKPDLGCSLVLEQVFLLWMTSHSSSLNAVSLNIIKQKKTVLWPFGERTKSKCRHSCGEFGHFTRKARKHFHSVFDRNDIQAGLESANSRWRFWESALLLQSAFLGQTTSRAMHFLA